MYCNSIHYCPYCKSVLVEFGVDKLNEGIYACLIEKIAFIPKDLGKYTRKMKKKLNKKK